MAVDCADVVYAMRVLYAAENGLPFAMKDPTTRKGNLISNDMTRWDAQPAEKRLRNFLQLIYGVGSTLSLPADTYPTAITPETLGAGSIILTDKAKHHSWTIQNISQTGIPYLLFGSRPARTLLYERNDYPSVPFVFPEGIRAETNAGFRNFRQPQDVGKPVDEVPGFSLEQYDFPPAAFMRTVQKRLQKVAETNQQRLARLYEEVCRAAGERVEAIGKGVAMNAELGSRCMDATQYDDFSTPSRDQRLKDTFLDLANSYQAVSNKKTVLAATRKLVESVLRGANSVRNSNAACRVEVSPGQIMTLGQIYALSVNDKLSNNPHDSHEMRWGLQAGPSAKASSCPTY